MRQRLNISPAIAMHNIMQFKEKTRHALGQTRNIPSPMRFG